MLKKYLWVFFISMVPLIEIRGAIPYALAQIELGNELNFPLCCAIAILGNMLPVPFIYFFARKVLEWGKDKPIIGKFFSWCLEKGHKGGAKLQEKAGKGIFWALFLFVGIPLPGTGAWTGTLAASILDMDFKKSVLAVIAGVISAGIIVGLICTGVFGALNFLL
ncbi:MAG: small multi-drug export protein [Lachnospiraceae bacterium]|nr:small multi-drug export protein [Lachnospiraceae bacterium]